MKAVGDLHIDHHHTTEDVGIALGQAVKQALGSMAGITRYASIHMPMDETLSRVVIDISGRPVLVFKVEFPRDKVGNFDTELVREWFNAFAINAGVTLHVETLYGENSHHIAESCFKGLARALRAAVAIDPRAAGEVPSTKVSSAADLLFSAESTDAGLHSSCSGGERCGRCRDRSIHIRPRWISYLGRRFRTGLAGLASAVAGADRLDRGFVVIDLGMMALGAGKASAFIANGLIALLMGFEAASLQRWTLSRRNWRQLDIVVADDEEAAERRFFDRWTARQRGANYDQWASDRGGPPPTRDIPGQPFRSRRPSRATSLDYSATGSVAMSVAIIEYGSGNLHSAALHSAAKAFERASRGMENPDKIVVTSRSRNGVSRRPHRAARRRRLRRLPQGPRCARRHGRGR